MLGGAEEPNHINKAGEDIFQDIVLPSPAREE